MASEEFVDATVFLGMHSTDEHARQACASFFATRLRSRVAMSLEQVGLCDHIVWRYPRHVQDAYYPFMDNLHTDLPFDRIGYDEHDMSAAHRDPTPVSAADRLLLALVANRGGILYTLNPRLLDIPAAPVRRCARTATRVRFPPRLEALYQESLALRIDRAAPCEDPAVRRACTGE